MKTQASLLSPLRALAVSSALLLAGTAHAGWDVSIGIPLQPAQYNSYESTTVYGVPGSQITTTRQVPQTTCRNVWFNGESRQECTTEYVTIQNGYVAPTPVYVAPAPVYVAPAPVYGYPGYGYNPYRRDRDWNPPRHHHHRPGPPPTTVYTQPSYGIGGGIPYNGGSLNIHLNGR